MWVGLVLAGAVAVGLADRLGVPTKALMTDASRAGGPSPFKGAVSNAGLIVWGAAAGALFVAASVQHGRRAAFLAVSGLGIAYLGFDDALLLHEEAAERYLGISDGVVYGLYGLSGLAWIGVFHRQVVNTRVVDLVAGGVGLAASSTADMLSVARSIEDVPKVVGIIALAAWSVDTARRALRADDVAPAAEVDPAHPVRVPGPVTDPR